MKKKFGFVYIWYDRHRKMYYIGSHWGRFDDGYICSSPWMKNAYSRRPSDFKRRILAIVDTCIPDLHSEEQRWLSMISDYELHDKYYNYKKVARGFDPNNPLPRNPKKQSQTLKKRWVDPEFAKRMREIRNSPEVAEKLRIALTGKKASTETREKQRLAKLGKLRGPHSEEHRQRISEAQKGISRPYASRPISEQQKMQISKKHKERWALISPELRTEVTAKMRAAKRPAGSPVSDVFVKSRRRGSENGNSKLTAEIVKEIRASSESGKKLAKKYSVSDATIYNVRNQTVWAHIDDAVDNRSVA